MLVDHNEHQVDTDQGNKNGRNQHDVEHVQTGHNVDTWELSAEQEERDVRTYQRNTLEQTVNDSETVT